MALHPALGTARRRLRRGPPVSAGGLVLTPVVLEERSAGATEDGCWLVAAKRPVAVIVAGPGGRHLLRLEDAARRGSGHANADGPDSGRATRTP